MNEREKEFFSPKEIWSQVFGKDGRGGAIGELHDAVSDVDNKVDDKFDKLEKMMCQEFENLSNTIKEYNGVKPRLEELETTVKEHVTDWESFQAGLKTREAIDEELDREHQKGVDEADKIFNKRMKVVKVIIGLSAVVISLLGLLFRFLFF